MKNHSHECRIATAGLLLQAERVSWDEEAFGHPVARITALKMLDVAEATRGYAQFQNWLNSEKIRIVSCRLPIEGLHESMFLEGNGFRFVEVVLHPTLENLQKADLPADSLLVTGALEPDLSGLQRIAENAFSNERYHVDPRCDPRLASLRYSRWVRNSLHHPTQRLYKISDGDRLVGLFITELTQPGFAYWHLTAIAPECQGLGYGQRVWLTMLRHHQAEGCRSLSTTISARNVAVLNLYAKLNFRFSPPEMTFHWVGDLL